MSLFSWLNGERHTSCGITIAYVIMIVSLCHAQSIIPPTGVWCTSDAVSLGNSVPFSVPQPAWWKEYFIFNAAESGTVGFKLYAQMPTDEYFTVIVGVNYCPNIVESANRTNAYSYGTADLLIDVDEGNTYVIFAHLPGASFTVVGCDGPCPMACPNDCTNLQGICDLSNGTCLCNPGWTGSNCSFVYTNNTNGTTPQPHHSKVPFGSEPVFISVVAGLPAALVVAGISAFFIFRAYRKKEKKMRRKEQKEPLIIPYPNGVNGYHHSSGGGNSAYFAYLNGRGNNGHANGHESNHVNGHDSFTNGHVNGHESHDTNRHDNHNANGHENHNVNGREEAYQTSEDFGLNRRSKNYDRN